MNTPLKNVIALLTLVLIGWLALTFITPEPSSEEITQVPINITEALAGTSYVFTTSGGSTGIVSYPADTSHTIIVGVDGIFYELTQAGSASGTRYTNEDETIIFQEHQGEALLMIGESAYQISSLTETSIEVFDISPEPISCSQSARGGMCLVVNGEPFADPIEGFNYEVGTTYRITVAKTPVESIQTGFAPYTYQLLEILDVQYTESKASMHPSWDTNEDGINDCEQEGSCDDTVDYTQSRPSTSPLEAQQWMWVQTQYPDETLVIPDTDDFVASFTTTGEFSSQTDCNLVFAVYEISGASMTFSALGSTKMACAGKVFEGDYLQMIQEVVSYRITDTNELTLTLTNGASMYFSPYIESTL